MVSGGDFHVIANMDEFIGPVVPDLGAISDFTDLLGQSDLQELPTSGGLFTWVRVRRRGRVCWKKLDRVLFNSHWLQRFPNSSMELLSRATSDHNPLLYKCLSPHSSPASFKFQNMWIRHPDFSSFVAANWSLPQAGFGMFRFSCKLRRLKSALRDWNKTVFGNVFDKVRLAEDAVKLLEHRFDSAPD